MVYQERNIFWGRCPSSPDKTSLFTRFYSSSAPLVSHRSEMQLESPHWIQWGWKSDCWDGRSYFCGHHRTQQVSGCAWCTLSKALHLLRASSWLHNHPVPPSQNSYQSSREYSIAVLREKFLYPLLTPYSHSERFLLSCWNNWRLSMVRKNHSCLCEPWRQLPVPTNSPV